MSEVVGVKCGGMMSEVVGVKCGGVMSEVVKVKCGALQTCLVVRHTRLHPWQRLPTVWDSRTDSTHTMADTSNLDTPTRLPQ